LTVEASLRPRGPYTFALTARGASDATRVVRDGLLHAVVHGARGPERTLAWQTPDGRVHVRAATEEAVDRVRFVLAVDDDHSEFLRRFRSDPLLREATWHLRGLRVLRAPTVALSLLRALCGQLIEARRAREIERRIVRATTRDVDGLRAPPTAADLAAPAPARLRALGLHARRAATLVRLCGSLDLERLHGVTTDVAAARIQRERGLGPWSVGVVCLEGLGRRERGLVGDLGLIKLCSALRGRWVDASETAELLEPYGEWAGLASVYLMAGFARGLVPLPPGADVRKPPDRIQRRAA
jgi:3-methyladenine DNA glycosylase/8-oxoguanine DNA glycosylase